MIPERQILDFIDLSSAMDAEVFWKSALSHCPPATFSCEADMLTLPSLAEATRTGLSPGVLNRRALMVPPGSSAGRRRPRNTNKGHGVGMLPPGTVSAWAASVLNAPHVRHARSQADFVYLAEPGSSHQSLNQAHAPPTAAVGPSINTRRPSP